MELSTFQTRCSSKNSKPYSNTSTSFSSNTNNDISSYSNYNTNSNTNDNINDNIISSISESVSRANDHHNNSTGHKKPNTRITLDEFFTPKLSSSISSSPNVDSDASRRPSEKVDDEVIYEARRLTVSQRCKRFFRYHWRGVLILFVPLASIYLLFHQPLQPMRCAYLLINMALFWMTEVIPIPVTSLLPIVALPLMGILDSETVCQQYFKSVVAFFFCSMVIALALEHSNLHKRLALWVMAFVGIGVKRLHVGITFLTAFVSLWIANAAAATLMIPIIQAILEELAAGGFCELYDTKRPNSEDDRPYPSRVVTCYYLSVSFAAGIGGLGIVMSSNTNIVFIGIYEERFPDSSDMDFTRFMFFNLPITIIYTGIMIAFMQFYFMGLCRKNSADAKALKANLETQKQAKSAIKEKIAKAEPMAINQILIAILFLVLIALLFTQSPGMFPGWADLLSEKKIGGTVTVAALFLLVFIIPANYYFLKYCLCKVPERRGRAESLLTWSVVAKKMPWGTMLLLGGGMALSDGMIKSGLSVLIGSSMRHLGSLPNPVILLSVILITFAFTSVSMNAAVASILTPVILELAVAVRVHPAYLGLGVLAGVSLSFLFPMSSAPNAVVYVKGNIRNREMFFSGLGTSIIGGILYFTALHVYAPLIFEEYDRLPAWAEN